VANHKSALKRIKTNEKRRIRNRAVLTRVKNVTKAVRAAAENNDADAAQTALAAAVATIDKAASKGVIPQRRASRKIGRLTRLVNSLG